MRLAKGRQTFLDLECGTGELAAAIAKTISTLQTESPNTVGVDPAVAMLAIAAKRRGGDRATWIIGDARRVKIGQKFDFIVLTGHTFQVFLTTEDQRAVLRTIAAHLSPNGVFIFDTRTPELRAWKNWTAAQSKRCVTHPSLGEIEIWTDAQMDNTSQIVTYHTHYRVVSTDKPITASARIRSTSKDELTELISQAGLVVVQWYGDWHGTEFSIPSADIIPFGRLA